MVVNDDSAEAEGLLEDPNPTAGGELPESIGHQEAIEALLPDLACVGAAEHAAFDDEHVAVAIRVVCLEVAELGQPYHGVPTQRASSAWPSTPSK